MERSEYEEVYGSIEWDLTKVNQYSADIEVKNGENRVLVRVPIRDTIAGECIFLPRDEDFEMKDAVKRVVQFETSYLPVSTPECEVEETTQREEEVFYQITENS